MPTKPKTHDPLPPYLRAKLAQRQAADQERRRKEYEQSPGRKQASALINSPRWRRFSKWFLRQPGNALCVACKAEGRITPATHTDHIKPRATHPELTWEPENCQGLCRSCHSRKTRNEQAGG